MLKERDIHTDWVERTAQDPDLTEEHGDGTRHYLKRISEHGNRWLRVVVNVAQQPPRCVTVFFDRRLGRRSDENQDG
jgi:hypothetical protein